jgi:hypothetical protein
MMGNERKRQNGKPTIHEIVLHSARPAFCVLYRLLGCFWGSLGDDKKVLTPSPPSLIHFPVLRDRIIFAAHKQLHGPYDEREENVHPTPPYLRGVV